MDADEADEPEWTLDALFPGEHDEELVPNARTVARLLDEYKTLWIWHPDWRGVPAQRAPRLTAAEYVAWISDASRLGFDPDLIDWNALRDNHNREAMRLQILNQLVARTALDEAAERCLKACARVIYSSFTHLSSIGHVLHLANPGDDEWRQMVSPEERVDTCDAARVISTNELTYDPKDINSFQNAFLTLQKRLHARSWRRAGGKFFERARLSSGVPTLAFREVMDVKDFVYSEIQSDRDFQLFCWATNPPHTREHLVSALTELPLSAAPDLVTNRHLRSYAGDAVGRGAGVYDCGCDMFFPYCMQHSWADMAAEVTRTRRRYDATYRCAYPDASNVCVLQLAVSFPYDIYGEVFDEAGVRFGASWRAAEPHECVRARLDDRPELTAALEAAAAQRDLRTVGPTAWGRAWQVVWDGTDLDSWACLDGNATSLRATLAASTSFIVYVDEADLPCDGAGATCVGERTYVTVSRDGEELRFVPLACPGKRARVRLDDAAPLDGVPLSADSCIQLADGQWLRVDTGRTWEECECREIDLIYETQQFTPHDCFFLYSLKGRLLFDVGEFDGHQMTLMLAGIGGCGKSTVLMAQQEFDPPHERGHLSSNMQPEFGMSAVCRARVIYCNEVSSDLKIVQEEWQTSVSGEVGSYAVKFKDPIVCKWRGQHFWVGNSFPTRFNNRQGQVSRRLAGVNMTRPVQRRDGNIIHVIRRKIGALQRKEVLAYRDFVRITGSIDPMGDPATLPPAFAEFYRSGQCATDPIEDFLTNGKYVRTSQPGDVALCMPMAEFRSMFDTFCFENNIKKPRRWDASIYLTAFNQRKLHVGTVDTYTDPVTGIPQNNVEVIHGLTRCT